MSIQNEPNEERDVHMIHVQTDKMMADTFAKALLPPKHQKFAQMSGMSSS